MMTYRNEGITSDHCDGETAVFLRLCIACFVIFIWGSLLYC